MKNQRWYRKGRNTIKAAGLGTMLLLLAFAGQTMADSAEDIKAAEETETVEETGRTEEEETEALEEFARTEEEESESLEETELSEETDPQTAKPFALAGFQKDRKFCTEHCTHAFFVFRRKREHKKAPVLNEISIGRNNGFDK